MKVEDSIQAILERNKRVEVDKAWEVSFTRRAFLTVLIYCTAALFLWMTGEPEFPLLSAIPAAGYLFSTLSLPWVKREWMRRHAPNGER